MTTKYQIQYTDPADEDTVKCLSSGTTASKATWKDCKDDDETQHYTKEDGTADDTFYINNSKNKYLNLTSTGSGTNTTYSLALANEKDKAWQENQVNRFAACRCVGNKIGTVDGKVDCDTTDTVEDNYEMKYLLDGKNGCLQYDTSSTSKTYAAGCSCLGSKGKQNIKLVEVDEEASETGSVSETGSESGKEDEDEDDDLPFFAKKAGPLEWGWWIIIIAGVLCIFGMIGAYLLASSGSSSRY